MDGTLTEAVHDFPKIRRELGLSEDEPILDSIRKAAPEEAARLNRKLDEIEWELAAQAMPAAGIHEFLIHLAERNCQPGILTRNRFDVALETLKRAGLMEFFSEEFIIDREKALPKPDPEGILLACKKLNTNPLNTIYLGDHLNDLEAGLSAGVKILGCLYGYSLDENTLNKLNYPFIKDISEIYSHLNI